jgi:DNA-binding response OmpR family regulator
MNVSSRKLPRALVFCNDPDSGSVWISLLEQKRIHSTQECFFLKAVERLDAVNPDLIMIVDNGSSTCVIDLIKELRSGAVNPILMVCDNWEEEDLLNAYLAGVDECILKPVSAGLFLAKVQAWLRRSWTIPTDFLEPVKTGGLVLIPSERHLVLKDGSIVSLTNLELRLLHLLMCRPNKIVTISELIRHMWRENGRGEISALKNVVYRLRKKMEADPANPCIIKNVAGAGYTFRME